MVNKFLKLSESFSVTTSVGLSVYKVDEISYCESQSNYTKICFKNGSSLVQAKTLRKLENFLKNKGFLRVHRSFLINTNDVKHFLFSQKNLIMADQSRIPVARRKHKETLKFFKEQL